MRRASVFLSYRSRHHRAFFCKASGIVSSVSYEDMDIALHYGAMLRECFRHQSVARFFLIFNEKEFGLSFDNISVAAIIYFYIIVQDYDIDSVRKSFVIFMWIGSGCFIFS
ncbi:hypothetical protein ZIOFF_002675 [Zingiber officinale]|uniref:Uncharacterized protein n=1 Tax=Zingiber officinale TaxID=94328 RepID=A0A8J5HWM4_ZINOF|nr:hypothetical protein ZIOFF_002675 [Zingiber officinale]